VTVLIPDGRPVIGADIWQAARGFAAGVSVVTSGCGDVVHGGTVSAFSVISREPPMTTIALRRDSFLLDTIDRHGRFVINVLASGQDELGRRFASRGRARGRAQFDDVPLATGTTGTTGPPILAGTVCWLECLPTDRMTAGDHELVLGTVVRWSPGAGEPLLCLSGSLCSAHTQGKEAR
jgi:flavin reductase (DIM6/NTAB) family NADH-FMN oxidoreductase RutF